MSFDDSEEAWKHYSKMYREIRDSASDSVEIPEDRITRAEIEIADTPVMDTKAPTLVIEPPSQGQANVPVQIQKVERVAAVLGPSLSAVIPPSRNGRLSITPDIRRQIARVSLVKSVEEVEATYFNVDRLNRTATLSGKPFPSDVQAMSRSEVTPSCWSTTSRTIPPSRVTFPATRETTSSSHPGSTFRP